MKFSKKWWLMVVLLYAFAATLSSLSAQREESSSRNVPGSSEVQSESNELQPSSNKPEQRQPTLVSNGDSTPADVEIDRRFNELRRELLDDRAKSLDWWLAATAIFLTFLAIIIPIAAFIGARFSFKKFNEIKEEAQGYVEDIKKRRKEAYSLVKGIYAEVASANLDKASEAVENVQQNPDSSPIDRAVADALLLQKRGKIEKAIEKWRAVALIAEESDKELAVRAWFSVALLLHSKDEPDLNAVIDANDKVLRLKPDIARSLRKPRACTTLSWPI